VLLKLGRLSERDLADVELVLASGEPVDAARVQAALAALPPTDDPDSAERRGRVAAALAAPR